MTQNAGWSKFVYYLQPGAHELIKIGYSNNIPSRLRALNNASPFPLLLRAFEPGGSEVESFLHHRFRSARVDARYGTSKEWFNLTPELAAHIVGLREVRWEATEDAYAKSLLWQRQLDDVYQSWSGVASRVVDNAPLVHRHRSYRTGKRAGNCP